MEGPGGAASNWVMNLEEGQYVLLDKIQDEGLGCFLEQLIKTMNKNKQTDMKIQDLAKTVREMDLRLRN